MKKLFTVILVVMLLSLCALTASFAGCTKPDSKEITVAMPDGAPALALAGLIGETASLNGFNLTYSIKDGTNIKSAVLSKEADIALVPMNIAAALYNGGVDIKLVSANIYGLLYLVGSESLEDGLASLVGEVVYNVGQGGTPDFTFKKILAENDIAYTESNTAVSGKVALAYMTPSALLPQLKTGIIKYAVLGEPQATLAVTGSANTVLVDLQEEWKEVVGSDTLGYPQVGLVVKTSLLENEPEFVRAFLDKVEANAEWVMLNAAEAGQIVKDNGGTMPITLTADIVSKCNIKFVTASDAKTDITDYLSALMSFAPASIGGKLPDQGFYYSIE